MGLAIDGNVVHGIARGGQAFLPITQHKDGSVVIDGHTYNDSLIGRGVSGLSSSTQYYLTGAYDGWYFKASDNSVGLPDSGIIAEEFKADKWHVVAIKGNEAGGLLTTLGPGTDFGNNKNVAWFAVDSLKISNALLTDVIANPPTSFSFLNTYSISVANDSFAVTPLSQITSSLKDSVDGVVLGNDGEQYLHLSNGDCFVKLSDATDEKDTQVGQKVNLTAGTEAYNLNYSNHKYNFTDQGKTIGMNHPEAIMNARFVINGTQRYHTDVQGYEANWF